MSVVPVSQWRADAASGQCLLPEDAFPWLFRRAHTCMLSPLSVCSLTFGTVKIEDTAGRKDAERIRRRGEADRVVGGVRKIGAPLQKVGKFTSTLFFWGLRMLFAAPKENVFLRCWMSHLPLFAQTWASLEARAAMMYSQVHEYCNTDTQRSFLARYATAVDLKGTRCASTADFQL